MTYEEAFKKLEEISQKLSSNEIVLEEATKLFDEAIRLTKICYEKLKQTEGQVLVFKGELEKLKPINID